jgi:hypothetical protein
MPNNDFSKASITAANLAAADKAAPQAGWRLYQWCKMLPCSRDQAQDWINEGVLPAARIGKVAGSPRAAMTFILISPEDFLQQWRVRAASGPDAKR